MRKPDQPTRKNEEETSEKTEIEDMEMDVTKGLINRRFVGKNGNEQEKKRCKIWMTG